MASIVLSYIKSDTAAPVAKLRLALAQLIPDTKLEMGVDSILRVKQDIPLEIERAIRQCSALLVVVGTFWKGFDDKANWQENPLDPDRLAITAALAQGKQVLVLLVGGATLAQYDPLPEALAPLHQMPQIALNPTQREADLAKIRQLLQPPAAESAPESLPVVKPYTAQNTFDPYATSVDEDTNRTNLGITTHNHTTEVKLPLAEIATALEDWATDDSTDRLPTMSPASFANDKTKSSQRTRQILVTPELLAATMRQTAQPRQVISLFDQPAPQALELLQLTPTMRLEIIKRQGEYYQVSYEMNLGWVRVSEVDLITEGTPAAPMVTRQQFQVRPIGKCSLFREPTTDSTVLTTITADLTLPVLLKQGEYYQVDYQNQVGWVAVTEVELSVMK